MNNHDPSICVRCQAIAQIVVKTCGCGRRYTDAEWKQLKLVGVQDDGVERIELRSCTCRSTIAIVLGPGSQAPQEAP